MRKIVVIAAVAVTACLVLGLAGCGKKTQQEDPEVLGGWTRTASPAVTPEVQALMDKALEGFTGAMYKPVAYVATQLVSGTNHLLLCTVSPVAADAKATYAMVTLYEDLQGNVTISKVEKSELDVPPAGLMGGWQAPESMDVDADLEAAFAKASEGWTGSAITPVALVGTQVVAGMNYRVLCTVAPVESGAQAHWALVTLYKDLQGGCTFSDIVNFAAE